MITMKNIDDMEAAIEHEIFGTAPSQKEKDKSRAEFETGIKNAIGEGGTLEIEDVKVSSGKMQRRYYVRTSPVTRLSITEKQAIAHCGYSTF